MVKKSISVTQQQDAWVSAQIETGRYGNESEVVRDLIRERQILGQQRPAETNAIRDVSGLEPLPYTIPIAAAEMPAGDASLAALSRLQTSLQERNIDFIRWEQDVNAERRAADPPGPE
jgi:putative addiction module CopG family antidote